MEALFIDSKETRLCGAYVHSKIKGVHCEFNDPNKTKYDVVVTADGDVPENTKYDILIAPTLLERALESDTYQIKFLRGVCKYPNVSATPNAGIELALTVVFKETSAVNSWLSLVDARTGAGSTGSYSQYPCVLNIYDPLSIRVEKEVFAPLCDAVLNDVVMDSQVPIPVTVSFVVDPKHGDITVFRCSVGHWRPYVIPYYDAAKVSCLETVLSFDTMQVSYRYALGVAVYAPVTTELVTLSGLNEKALRHAWLIGVGYEPPYPVVGEVVGYCLASGLTLEECKRRVYRNYSLSWRVARNHCDNDTSLRSDVFRGLHYINQVLLNHRILDEAIVLFE